MNILLGTKFNLKSVARPGSRLCRIHRGTQHNRVQNTQPSLVYRTLLQTENILSLTHNICISNIPTPPYPAISQINELNCKTNKSPLIVTPDWQTGVSVSAQNIGRHPCCWELWGLPRPPARPPPSGRAGGPPRCHPVTLHTSLSPHIIAAAGVTVCLMLR